MKLKIMQGASRVLNTHIGKGEILVNLMDRWPEDVKFDSKLNQLCVVVRKGEEPIILRASSPIAVSQISSEKDQICVVFSPRPILSHAARHEQPAP